MRPLALLGLPLILCAMLPVSGCDNSATASPKADAAKLSSLSPEQQAAVRAMVRETLIQNPDILVEASTALRARENAKTMTQIMSEASDISMGPEDAPVTVVEFFDYRCGYCHAANDYVFNLVQARKDVRIVFKELPILSPESEEAARAAIAVHKQNPAKYPPFHKALMKVRGEFNMGVVERVATSQGIDVARMKADMNAPAVRDEIAKVREQALALGINGTPGFVINGHQVPGFSAKDIDAAINDAANAAKTGKTVRS